MTAARATALLDDLRRKAAAEADASRATAAAEAARLRRAAADAVAERSRIARDEVAREAARMGAVAEAESMRAANERLLPARAAALDRVFVRSAARIEARLAHPGAGDAVAGLVAAAVGYLPDGPVRARCHPALCDSVRRSLAGHTSGACTVVADDRVPLGAILETGDGTIAVDATFARRLEHERAHLAAELAARLAGPTP